MCDFKNLFSPTLVIELVALYLLSYRFMIVADAIKEGFY